METTQRTGENWQAFLKRYRITGIEDIGNDIYRVSSVSGHTYSVQIHTNVSREDGGIYFTWSCDCPSRKRCRHIEAVVQMRWAEAAAEGDYDGMDIMEREV